MAIVAVFTAQVFGIDLSWTDYITLVLVSIISSIGVAGVPGPAVISTTVVLTALGLPLEGIAIVAGEKRWLIWVVPLSMQQEQL